MTIFLDSSSIFLDSSSTVGRWTNTNGSIASSICIFPPPRQVVETAKQARRRICRENLSKMWPPSETTRRHRKEVRVTDLARPSIYLLFRDDEVVYVGQSKNPYARMAQHLKDKRFTHVRIMSCRKLRLRHWEEKLIKAYKPQYNIVHNLYK